jgi:hypothetical protein
MMQKIYNFLLIALLSYLILAITSFSPRTLAATPTPTPRKTIFVPQKMILPIGVKIWSNESGGTFSGILNWNEGEDFASLGIGHFVWRPKYNNATSQDDFPQLIKYMQKRGVKIPSWLSVDDGLYCPCTTREDFYFAQKTNSPQILELRQLLLNTIPIQAEYITYRLEIVLPKLLASVPPEERPYVCQKFYSLIQTQRGLYAVTDYLNFKGSGANKHNYHYGCGLLQVLEEMRYAPKTLSSTQAFTWSARMLLVRHVTFGQTKYNEDAWLNGWLNRVETYLPRGEKI